jgi:cell division protein FtsA
MATEQYLVAIDAGSSSVKLAVASRSLDEKGRVQIFALLERPCTGIKKGIITDMSEVSRAVYDLVAETESVIGISIREALIGINGYGVEFIHSEGYIPISGQEVSEDDVDRVVYDSLKKAYNLRDKEILQFIPLSFSLDDQEGIRNPIGLIGEKLSCRTVTITAEPGSIRNFCRIFSQAELDIIDKLYMPFVGSELILTPRQKSVGAVLVDIGYSTTTYTVWANDEIIGSGTIPVGGEKITSDLAYGIQTSMDIAEEVKKNHLNLIYEGGGKNGDEFDLFDPETQSNYSLNTHKINSYALDRVEEIFLLLHKDLHRNFGRANFAGGLVLTGGGANLKGIHEVAREVTGLPVYKNVYNDREVRFILDFNNDPTFAGVISMVTYALKHPEEIGQDRNIFDNAPYSRVGSDMQFGRNKKGKGGIFGFFKGMFTGD